MKTRPGNDAGPDLSGPIVALFSPDSETHRSLTSELAGLGAGSSGFRVLLHNAEDIRRELVRRLGPAAARGRFKQVRVVMLAPGEASAALTDRHLLEAVPLPAWISRAEASWVLGLVEGRKLRTLFMAVVDLGLGKIVGYEALTRGIDADGAEIDAGRLFDAARREMLLSNLDRAALEHALETAAQSDLPGLIFLNIEPASLLENAIDGSTLRKLCRDFGIPPTRVVVELTRAADTSDPAAVAAVLKPFQEFGMRVSLDDLGAGLATFDLLIKTRPDYAKLDPQFVRRVHEDPTRRQILSALNSLCVNANVACIAEGVAAAAELRAVKEAGVAYAQGWYFGHPVAWDRRSPGSLRETTSFRTGAS